MNNFDAIYTNIIGCFDQLWSFKNRGDNTLEIITPYSTTSDKFVSLFLTKRDDKFVVSDGGLLHGEAYESKIDYDNQCLLKILYHLEDYYEIKTTQDRRGYKHYYKTTSKETLIPNLVYEMAQFISMCVSSATVPFIDEKEKEEKETFRKQVNSFLTTIVPNDKIALNDKLDKENFRAVRFNAIVRENNSLSLINYISGSNVSYFTKSISNASVLFEIADGSPYKDYIKNKIAIVNNSAEGYVTQRLYKHLEILKEHTGHEPINWSEKERLKTLFN